MISFYPGPSKLYPQVKGFLAEAFDAGIMSINHRSSEFESIASSAISGLKNKLNIPDSYSVFFTSSATECWEIIGQSLTKIKSLHLCNGAFAEKWFDYTHRILPGAEGLKFDGRNMADLFPTTANIVCLTQNETSNGTQLRNETIAAISKAYPEKILAVDVTSSLGGIILDFINADVWLASVQKCLGLPAGLGLLICSPRALQVAAEIREKNHYNSLLLLHDMMKKNQTSCTPNVLNIFLLKKLLEVLPSISEIHPTTMRRAGEWYSFIEKFSEIIPLVKDEKIRSDTVITVKGEPESIRRIKEAVKAEGIILGNGYGEWAETTFRIANFPAIEDHEITILKNLLEHKIS